jgi:hypothetical protein
VDVVDVDVELSARSLSANPIATRPTTMRGNPAPLEFTWKPPQPIVPPGRSGSSKRTTAPRMTTPTPTTASSRVTYPSLRPHRAVVKSLFAGAASRVSLPDQPSDDGA